MDELMNILLAILIMKLDFDYELILINKSK